MDEEVNATTTFHVTRLVGKRREYLVGASGDNTWVAYRAEASGWDTEDGARLVAKATHDARACVERYTITVVVGEPVYSATT